ncbi:hypothetical protein FHS15_004773 [Paenibacillus castaneae]|uniref:hypothetical protein n=1 Tax=Paenibacillus castaneae TaxID=474957 RepID=UPI000C9D1FD1|nr:hypothetical protein [Paenibacillus castaneae]NIK79612.1 hypothetical protein [Paenibacillus castaneae]
MQVKKMRFIAIATSMAALILFAIDGFWIHTGELFDGLGLLSSFILPPIGIVFAILAVNKTGSMRDMVLILLNVFALLLFFMWMFFGTLFFGP